MDVRVPPRCVNSRGRGQPRMSGVDMGQGTCAVDGCGQGARSRGWCEKHYTRWARHGDPLYTETGRPGRTGQPREHRFWAKVDVGHPLGCWEWRGQKTLTGYGSFPLERGRGIMAHRFAYQQLVGEIPEGLELDHLCRNRGCVNPDHLEPVTHLENMRRSPRGSYEGPCAVEGCTRGGPYTRGWCHMHYTRWERSGDVGEATSRLTRATQCAIEGCPKGGPFMRGWCQMHYTRWHRTGTPQ